VTNTAGQTTFARSTGNFDLAYAGGPNTVAVTNGTLNLAVAQGSNVQAQAGNLAENSDTGNVAFVIANESAGLPDDVFAGGATSPGVGNVAINIGGTRSALGTTFVEAVGSGNLATNLGGTGNAVQAGSTGLPATLSNAFAIGGTNNEVFAGPGPFNVAGVVNQTNANAVNNIH
jgi:hypothetical protein